MITLVTIGDLTFNQANGNYWISDIAGLEMPPVRVVDYNLAGEHFGLFVSALYGKRAFSLQGWVTGSDVSDFITKRDALQNALNIISGEIAINFTLANSRQVTINAIPTKLDFMPDPGVLTAAKFNIGFSASFPFLVSTSENSASTGLAISGGGTVPPPEMPMALTGNSGGSISGYNYGNGIYYPTARIYGPVTNPSIRNDTLNKELRLTATLISGQYLDVDFKRKTIIDQNGSNKYSIKTGDWWYMVPGSNIIKFLADAYDVSALVTLYWRDSYLGI
jgi:hypothetical protein